MGSGRVPTRSSELRIYNVLVAGDVETVEARCLAVRDANLEAFEYAGRVYFKNDPLLPIHSFFRKQPTGKTLLNLYLFGWDDNRRPTGTSLSPPDYVVVAFKEGLDDRVREEFQVSLSEYWKIDVVWVYDDEKVCVFGDGIERTVIWERIYTDLFTRAVTATPKCLK
ncbi:MAG TPA: hypothetical protein ENN60_03675 [archaeon]|nr:hypothetical protein [archaeon]